MPECPNTDVRKRNMSPYLWDSGSIILLLSVFSLSGRSFESTRRAAQRTPSLQDVVPSLQTPQPPACSTQSPDALDTNMTSQSSRPVTGPPAHTPKSSAAPLVRQVPGSSASDSIGKEAIAIYMTSSEMVEEMPLGLSCSGKNLLVTSSLNTKI